MFIYRIKCGIQKLVGWWVAVSFSSYSWIEYLDSFIRNIYSSKIRPRITTETKMIVISAVTWCYNYVFLQLFTWFALKFGPVDWPGTENCGLNVAKLLVLPAKCANEVPWKPGGNCGICGTKWINKHEHKSLSLSIEIWFEVVNIIIRY